MIFLVHFKTTVNMSLYYIYIHLSIDIDLLIIYIYIHPNNIKLTFTIFEKVLFLNGFYRTIIFFKNVLQPLITSRIKYKHRFQKSNDLLVFVYSFVGPPTINYNFVFVRISDLSLNIYILLI